MDKETLSHYGWIIVMILTLSIMLAFATPLGKYVGKGVANIAMGFIDANDNAVDSNNIEQMGNKWDDYLNGKIDKDTPDAPENPSTPEECSHQTTRIEGQKEATCTTKGYTGDTYCSDCNEKLSNGNDIAMKSHTAITDKAVGATCTTTGLTEGSHCGVCNAIIVKQEIVPKLSHTYEITGHTDATCNELGNDTYICTGCGDSYSQAISILGHDYKTTVKNATCTENGSITYTCSRCSDSYTIDGASATGHNYQEVVTKVATCTEAGIIVHICDNCNDSYTTNSAVLGHINGTPIKEKEINATCTKDGSYDMVTYCKRCNAELKRNSNVVQATGHKDSNNDEVCDNCGTSLKTYTAGTLVFKTNGTAYLYGENNTVQKTYTGWMTKQYSNASPPPWKNERTQIKTVIIEANVNPTYTDYWFWSTYASEYTFTSITIENGLTKIGDRMFNYCKNITEVTIPDSVTTIGSSAFESCKQLQTVKLSNKLTTINGAAFRYCSQLQSITIPNSVTTCGTEVFYECTSLKNISIGTGLTTLDTNLFNKCSSLTSVTIPNNIKFIESGVFLQCTSLNSVYIGSGAITIPAYAFVGCTNLKAFTISSSNPNFCVVDGVIYNKAKTTLACYPYGKTNQSFAIPSTVTSINNYAFYGNNNLYSITIQSNISSAGAGAFDSCKNLTTVNIGSGVSTINGSVFSSFDYLQQIVVNEGNPYFCSVDGVVFSKDMKSLVRYPTQKPDESFTIPNGVTTINQDAFDECTEIKEIIISDTVTTIKGDAFYGCDNLTKVTIGASVNKIESYAFYGCSKLTNLTFTGSGIWYYTTTSTTSGGTQISVSNATTNATNFKSTYASKYWYKV